MSLLGTSDACHSKCEYVEGVTSYTTQHCIAGVVLYLDGEYRCPCPGGIWTYGECVSHNPISGDSWILRSKSIDNVDYYPLADDESNFLLDNCDYDPNLPKEVSCTMTDMVGPPDEPEESQESEPTEQPEKPDDKEPTEQPEESEESDESEEPEKPDDKEPTEQPEESDESDSVNPVDTNSSSNVTEVRNNSIVVTDNVTITVSNVTNTTNNGSNSNVIPTSESSSAVEGDNAEDEIPNGEYADKLTPRTSALIYSVSVLTLTMGFYWIHRMFNSQSKISADCEDDEEEEEVAPISKLEQIVVMSIDSNTIVPVVRNVVMSGPSGASRYEEEHLNFIV